MWGFFHSKKFLILGIVVVLFIILIPLALIFIAGPLKQKQSTQKVQTSTFQATTKLADFNGAPIYVSTLDKLALEIYRVNEAKNLDPISIDNLLNTYVERKILDSQNLGDISSQSAQFEKNLVLNENQVKYQALRETFTATHFKCWSLYTINFWLPPTNADGSLLNGPNPADSNQTNADRLKLVSDVNNALTYAQIEMQQGTSVFNIATQINKNYPSLSAILAINGAIFSKLTDTSFWNSPTTYYYDKTNAGDPFYKTFYAMTESSPVTKVLNNNNMGGNVIKVIKVNNPNGILDNYNDWLKSQESGLKITNDAIKKIERSR